MKTEETGFESFSISWSKDNTDYFGTETVDDSDVADYLEYYNRETLSMSFDGDIYDVFNYDLFPSLSVVAANNALLFKFAMLSMRFLELLVVAGLSDVEAVPPASLVLFVVGAFDASKPAGSHRPTVEGREARLSLVATLDP